MDYWGRSISTISIGRLTLTSNSWETGSCLTDIVSTRSLVLFLLMTLSTAWTPGDLTRSGWQLGMCTAVRYVSFSRPRGSDSKFLLFESSSIVRLKGIGNQYSKVNWHLKLKQNLVAAWELSLTLSLAQLWIGTGIKWNESSIAWSATKSTTLVATNTGFEQCIKDWLHSIVSIHVHSLSNKMLVQKHCCLIMLTKWTNCIPYSSDVSMINWNNLPSNLHYYSLQLQVSYINNYFNLWILFSAGSSRLKHLGVRTVFINTWQRP